MPSVARLGTLKATTPRLRLGATAQCLMSDVPRLAIEVDGNIHETKKEYDRNRDSYLKGCGSLVLRFTNDEIDLTMESVVETIGRFLQSLRGILGGAVKE